MRMTRRFASLLLALLMLLTAIPTTVFAEDTSDALSDKLEALLAAQTTPIPGDGAEDVPADEVFTQTGNLRAPAFVAGLARISAGVSNCGPGKNI